MLIHRNLWSLVLVNFFLCFCSCQPNTGKPNTGKPNTGKPNTGKPNTSKPNTSKPNTSKPNTGQPATSKDDGPAAETPNDGGKQASKVSTEDKAAIAAKVETNPQRDAYFGELHLHAAYSLDAYGWGTRLTPDGAYRFAQGEEVSLPSGGKTKITAPLDFAAVTEHSEWLGEVHMITNKDHPQYNHEFAKQARDGDERFFKTILAAEDSGKRPADFSGEKGEHAYAALQSVWQEIVETTERHYQPGKFTTLHAFEWTAAPGGSNMHRNVIFRGGPDAVPDQPTSWFESRTVEELWDWMEQAGGGEKNVLAIPHNANMSGGLMFKPNYSDGRAMDEAYARKRSISEPLMEIIQAKGASESHSKFAPNDEFINFELVPLVNFVGPVENSPYMWMREGLKHGLKYEGELGVNPFKYGIVAGTDQHNGLMGDTDEFDFHGSHGLGDADPKTRLTGNMEVFDLVSLNPGGLTGVWSDANTREHIWDGLKRKETFGTSGVRIRPRFFGGYDFTPEMAEARDFAKLGYEKGVPMGHDLSAPPEGKSPTFIVWATRDPLSGNLDRIQIIKGWQDAEGALHEKIYNVAWSGDRDLGDDGKLPPVGDTVDKKTFEYENTIGAAELSGFWTDPDFESAQRAFYYLRVLEIPTPRYSSLDAVRNRQPLAESVPSTIQERAWTSPIWYSPSS